ncbi:MAG: HIT domain-containing protein [Candidatus Omnitrophica bacterium]|nr:HIT domain-containing protein [Candidatus Omnitrophota bacterium]
MDKLWAPWRIKYVTQNKQKGCIFCKAHRGKNDQKHLVVFRSSHCFVMLNAFPYNNGHVMVVSNRHIASLEELNDAEILDINKTLILMIPVLKGLLKAQGFNAGVNMGKLAGAGVDKHLHMHLVPRWLGDTNFMPTITQTKIISQSLKELYNQITKVMK